MTEEILTGVKCINKIKKKLAAFCLIAFTILSLAGCGNKVSNPYHVYDSSDEYRLTSSSSSGSIKGFSTNLALPLNEDSPKEMAPDIGTCAAASVYDVTQNKALYNYQMLKKVYPASTTKILTAYLAIKYGNPDQEVTVGSDILGLESGSSLAHLNPGDVISLQQLLYGLMLPSGNDAAIAIADAVSGSTEKFVELMNKEANALGATHSHFVTVNGLHDENHYTTPYDMYLIFAAACKYDRFVQLISSTSFNAFYRNSAGAAVQQTWTNSCRYLKGTRKPPEGITVVGGKTGTTGEAKYCLVLLSTASNGDQLISTVFGADSAYNLYLDMNEILTAAQNQLIKNS